MFLARAIGVILVVSAISAQTQTPSGAAMSRSEKYWVYVGTAAYSGAPSKRLYVGSFDAKTGALKMMGLAAATENPGFLAVRPDQQFLYSTNEVGEFRGQKTGGVTSFRIDRKTGKLELLNQVPAFGANPAYITVSRNGKFVLVASYYGGVMSIPIQADGSLGLPAGKVQESGTGVNPQRQESPHPHSVVLSPDNRFAVVVDLGLDKLFVYRFDHETGTLAANSPAYAEAPPGSGPRHLAFSRDGQFAYVVNELKSTVSTYAFDAGKGTFRLLQTISTLPPHFAGENTGAEVQVSPSGRFVYVSNRGHDSIGVFEADAREGTLKPIQDVSTEGKTPRNFVFDPSGRVMLVGDQDSDKIVVFRVDVRTGRLRPTAITGTAIAPVCLSFAEQN